MHSHRLHRSGSAPVLFECFEDPESEYAFVPNTLTEVYQEAITHLDKHDFRKFDGQISTEAIQKLQSLAFKGIEHGQLVFSNESFDEQMRKSGLLNKLYNPYSQAQQQFCFIHLTIQEFLAGKHVTETFTPEEIIEFITSHFESGKWHLVLQFIAGLLGKKITKLFQRHYSDCVLAFAKCLIVKNGKLELSDDISLRVIKCLAEVHDEYLIKKCTETAAMNDVVDLSYELVSDSTLPLALSDWDAVALVCKHMKNLTSLELTDFNADCQHMVDVTKLLEQRCIKKLQIQSKPISGVINVKGAISALLKSSCTVEHEHSKVTELLFGWLYIFNDTWSDFLNFFKVGRARDLEKLVLAGCLGPKTSMSLFKIITNEHCPKLTYLDLSDNSFSQMEVKALCLCCQRLFNLAQLYLQGCCLQEECLSPICELLTNERCNLSLLSLASNRKNINPGSLDGCVQKICRALQNKHCKLIMLDLAMNKLTDQCISDLCNALQNDHCKLNEVNLAMNRLTDQCIPDLCRALQNKHCKLIMLNLAMNKLTDQCIPDLCKALQNEHCKLTALSLENNEGITNEGLRMLCECSLPEEQQKRILNLFGCSLTNDCIPYLRNAVENEHCILKELKLAKSVFSQEEQEHLHQLETNQMKFELV